MATNEKKRKGRQFNLLLRIMISAILIIWLGFTINWTQFSIILSESSLLYIFIAMIAIQLTVLASVWKWQLLVNVSTTQQEKRKISLGRLGRFYYIGLFFNNFLPSSVGGDVIRIYQLGKIIGMSPSAVSVGFERLTSGTALLFILIMSALVQESVRPFLGSIIILVILFLMIFFMLWLLMKHYNKRSIEVSLGNNPKSTLLKWMDTIKAAMVKIGETISNYRQQRLKWWCYIAILSFMFQIGLVWINDLLFQALHVDVPMLELLVIITLTSAITMLPISINGIGVREVSYIYFFQKLGIPEEIAISVSLLFFLLVSVSSLIGGVFWLSERRE